jgi:predicted SAM-dependent methyltransferase
MTSDSQHTLDQFRPPASIANDLVGYAEWLAHMDSKGMKRGRAVVLLRHVTTPAIRFSFKLYGTRALAPVARRRAARLALNRQPLLLHLGSGKILLERWVNVDLVGMNPDVWWDLLKPLPWPDASADGVFLEHVIEHFPLDDVLRMLRDIRRVLRPGGVARVAVPDLGRFMKSYAGDGEFIRGARAHRPTLLLAAAEVTQTHGHRSAWDAETLTLALRTAGFEDVRECAFGESRLDPAPESAGRAAVTVYAEGVRKG